MGEKEEVNRTKWRGEWGKMERGREKNRLMEQEGNGVISRRGEWEVN